MTIIGIFSFIPQTWTWKLPVHTIETLTTIECIILCNNVVPNFDISPMHLFTPPPRPLSWTHKINWYTYQTVRFDRQNTGSLLGWVFSYSGLNRMAKLALILLWFWNLHSIWFLWQDYLIEKCCFGSALPSCYLKRLFFVLMSPFNLTRAVFHAIIRRAHTIPKILIIHKYMMWQRHDLCICLKHSISPISQYP